MLSYRHAFHAGNHADILKHSLLLAVLRYLNRKETAWWYVDSHAGAGMYDLDSDYAKKTAEFETGIGRLWRRDDLPAMLADYISLVRAVNPNGELRLCPGSPWLAYRLMRPIDQLRLFELHSSDGDLLQRTFSEAGRHVKIRVEDGLDGLRSVLPPQPRRGLVLIDPSYEIKDDYRRVIEAVKDALKRFATGTYAIWHPLLQRDEALRLPDRLKRLPVTNWLHATLTVHAPWADGYGMHGSGMFLINPPWGMAEQVRDLLPYLTDVLGQDEGATYSFDHRDS